MPHFEVTDFGPLAHATVEVKPLTVFLGPNSSGKSYMALAIYSLYRTLRVTPFRLRRGFSPEVRDDELAAIADAIEQAWPDRRSIPFPGHGHILGRMDLVSAHRPGRGS